MGLTFSVLLGVLILTQYKESSDQNSRDAVKYHDKNQKKISSKDHDNRTVASKKSSDTITGNVFSSSSRSLASSASQEEHDDSSAISSSTTASLSSSSSSHAPGKNQMGPEIMVPDINTFFGTNLKELVKSQELSFTVDGQNINATRDSIEWNKKDGSFTWIGKTNNKDNQLVVISMYNGYVGAHLTRDDGASYTLQFDGRSKSHVLRRINDMYFHGDTLPAEKHTPSSEETSAALNQESSALAGAGKRSHSNDTMADSIPSSDSSLPQEEAVAAAATGATVVDVVFGYTRDALSYVGTHDAIVASLNSSVALTNKIATNSIANVQFRILNVSPLSYTATGDSCSEASKIVNSTTSQFKAMSTLKDQYGADLATVITASMPTNNIGCAYYPGTRTDLSNSNSAGRGVLVAQYFNTPLFAHEWGHNLGLSHQDCDGGVKSYGCGYSFRSGSCAGGTCLTIMWDTLYRDSRSIHHYSNPNVLFNGIRTGVANSRDEARALNEEVAIIAAIRAPKVVVSGPPTISSVTGNQSVLVGANVTLSVVASGSGTLSYQWKKDGANLIDNAVYLGSKTSSLKISNIRKADAGQYQVVVSNTNGATTSSMITVTVNDVVNQAPIARAGSPQTITVGKTVQLDGSASSDPEGRTLTYRWSQVSGPTIALSSTTTAKPTFVANTIGEVILSLVVNDGVLNSTSSQVKISVVAQTTSKVALTNLNISSTTIGNYVLGTRFRALKSIRVRQLIIDASLNGSSNNVALYRYDASKNVYIRVRFYSVSTGSTKGNLNPAVLVNIDETLSPGYYIFAASFSAYHGTSLSSLQKAPEISEVITRGIASSTFTFPSGNNTSALFGHINFKFDPL